MKKTVYRKVIIYVKQEVEYGPDAELEDETEELELRIMLNVDSMQDGGCSTYEYRLGDIRGVEEADFPHWMFE